jgi:hypothetical protein
VRHLVALGAAGRQDIAGSSRTIPSSDLHDSSSQNEQHTPYDQTEILMMFVGYFVIGDSL